MSKAKVPDKAKTAPPLPDSSTPDPSKINFVVDIECIRENLARFEGMTALPDMNFSCTFDPQSKSGAENWQTSPNFQTQEVTWSTRFVFSPDWETCKNILQNPFRLKVNSVPPPTPGSAPPTPKAGKKEEKPAKGKKDENVLECLEIISLKLTDLFFEGKTTTVTWSAPEKGVSQLTVKVSLDGPKIATLTPPDVAFLLITLVSAQNLPSEPHSFKELDDQCLPVYLAFDMWSDGSAQYMATEAVPHASNVTFGHDHVLTAPSMQILLAKSKSSKLVIQVRDRDLKDVSKTQVDGRKVLSVDSNPPSVPYGVAMFDLYPVFDGPKGDVKLTANILPHSAAKKIYNDDPKAFRLLEGRYGESDSKLKIRVRYHVREAQVSQPFMSSVLLCQDSAVVPTFLSELTSFVQATNTEQLSPDALAGVSAEDLEKKDFLSGFIVDDGERAVACIEGLPTGIDSVWSRFEGHLSSGVVKGLRSDHTRYETRKYVGSHPLAGRGLDYWSQQYITGYPIEVKGKDDVPPGHPDANYEFYGLFRHARLLQPIRTALQSKAIYLRDTCGPLAFSALNSLNQLFECKYMREVESAGLLPSFEALERLWGEYGAPPSLAREPASASQEGQEGRTEGLEGEGIPEEVEEEEEAVDEFPPPPDQLGPHETQSLVDHYNVHYVQWKRKTEGETKDFITMNKKYPASIQKPRPKPTYSCVPDLTGEVYSYSSQRLNVTEMQKRLIQERAVADNSHYYTYSAGTLTSTVTKPERPASRSPSPPGTASSQHKRPFSVLPVRDPSEFIKHPKKPPEWRVEDLKEEFHDPVDHKPVRDATGDTDFVLFPSMGGTFEKDPEFFQSVHMPDPVAEAERARQSRPSTGTALKIAPKPPSSYLRAGSPLVDKWAPSRQMRADPPMKDSLKFIPVEVPPLSLVDRPYEDTYRRPFGEFNTIEPTPISSIPALVGQPTRATTSREKSYRTVMNQEKDVPLSKRVEVKRPIAPLTEEEKKPPLFPTRRNSFTSR